jgi:hypothetical protein
MAKELFKLRPVYKNDQPDTVRQPVKEGTEFVRRSFGTLYVSSKDLPTLGGKKLGDECAIVVRVKKTSGSLNDDGTESVNLDIIGIMKDGIKKLDKEDLPTTEVPKEYRY